MKSNKFWILVLGAVVGLSVTALIFFRQSSGSIAKIYQNGVLIENIDLSTVSEAYLIKTEFGGGTNTIEIETGRIRVVYANCLDSSCVRMGWNSGSRTPIVCLPNRLVITVEGSSDIDAIVGKVKE